MINDFINTINRFIAQTDAAADLIKSVTAAVSGEYGASVILADLGGGVISEAVIAPFTKNELANIKGGLGNRFNLRGYSGVECNICVLPLIAGNEHIATLFSIKREPFTIDEQAGLAFVQTVFTLSLGKITLAQAQTKKSQLIAVRSSLSSLSYREIEAACIVFKALGGAEGCVVASAVAKTGGVTRSAIVNALRKLESALLVECRSLGVKGTYIKVKNPCLPDELKKYEKLK